jgi:hypothetical protein
MSCRRRVRTSLEEEEETEWGFEVQEEHEYNGNEAKRNRRWIRRRRSVAFTHCVNIFMLMQEEEEIKLAALRNFPFTKQLYQWH